MKKLSATIFLFFCTAILLYLGFSRQERETPVPRPLPETERVTALALSAPAPPSPGVEFQLAREERTNDYYIVSVERNPDGKLIIVGEPKKIE